jgi:hypothetical protein
MKRLLLALFLASTVVAVAQTPTGPQQTKAEKKVAKKAAASAKAATGSAPSPVPTAKPVPAAKAALVSSAIVANKATKTYHRANCTYVAKMNETNRVGFANAAEAAKAGYKPCKVCKPE